MHLCHWGRMASLGLIGGMLQGTLSAAEPTPPPTTLPASAAGLAAEYDKLYTLRGAAYQTARDAVLKQPAAKDFLTQRVASQPADWQACALLQRLTNAALAAAADAWKPADSFTNQSTGLDADILQPEAMAALKLRAFECPSLFGPKTTDPKFDRTAYVALLLEHLARNPAQRTDGFRAWMLYFTLGHLPLSAEDSRRGQVFLSELKPPAQLDTVRFQSWVTALLADTEDPLTRLFAAGRGRGEPSEKILIANSRLDAPLGALAGLFYAGRLPNRMFTLASPSAHGAWLEGWAGRLKPRQVEFIEKCFVTKPLTDRIAGKGAHQLEWTSYPFSELLGSHFRVASALLAPDPKRFSAALIQVYMRSQMSEIAETLARFDQGGSAALPPEAVQLELKKYYRQIGSHLQEALFTPIDSWPLKTDLSKDLRECLREGSHEYQTPFFSGKELDQLVADLKKWEPDLRAAP